MNCTPRYLCRHLVSRAADNISPVVSFLFRCNFVMINYWTRKPTVTSMESLSDPAGMILGNRKCGRKKILFFLID